MDLPSIFRYALSYDIIKNERYNPETTGNQTHYSNIDDMLILSIHSLNNKMSVILGTTFSDLVIIYQ